MKTESDFINSLVERGILKIQGDLGSYRVSFSDNREYFCDLEESGQMFIRTPTGRFRYFPRDFIEQNKEEFDFQASDSPGCKICVMTFSDEKGNSWTRHTGYAVVNGSSLNEFNLSRNFPQHQRNMLPQPWYTQNPARLSLVAMGIDSEFLASDPNGTNAQLAKDFKCFKYAAIVISTEIAAAHIFMDSEIDNRTGIRYHSVGK